MRELTVSGFVLVQAPCLLIDSSMCCCYAERRRKNDIVFLERKSMFNVHRPAITDQNILQVGIIHKTRQLGGWGGRLVVKEELLQSLHKMKD
jgi:hypothetical protein